MKRNECLNDKSHNTFGVYKFKDEQLIKTEIQIDRKQPRSKNSIVSTDQKLYIRAEMESKKTLNTTKKKTKKNKKPRATANKRREIAQSYWNENEAFKTNPKLSIILREDKVNIAELDQEYEESFECNVCITINLNLYKCTRCKYFLCYKCAYRIHKTKTATCPHCKVPFQYENTFDSDILYQVAEKLSYDCSDCNERINKDNCFIHLFQCKKSTQLLMQPNQIFKNALGMVDDPPTKNQYVVNRLIAEKEEKYKKKQEKKKAERESANANRYNYYPISTNLNTSILDTYTGPTFYDSHYPREVAIARRNEGFYVHHWEDFLPNN